MANPQGAIDEMLPMISEFLTDLGLDRNGSIDFEYALYPFSNWITEQVIGEEDFAYLASRVAAFFSHYYIQKCGATLRVFNNKVFLKLPLGSDVYQEIEPYTFAIMVTNKDITLLQAIDANVS